ncbi:hypothetical protein B0H14DRAFT_3149421, partial [Mycena olivaceomarginata]
LAPTGILLLVDIKVWRGARVLPTKECHGLQVLCVDSRGACDPHHAFSRAVEHCLQPWRHNGVLCGSFITTFCTSVASEVIGPGDSAQRCFTTSTPTLKGDFTGLNTHNVSSGINVTNCENALESVNATCSLGGWGQVSGAPFRFFGDPNTGPCRGSCGN